MKALLLLAVSAIALPGIASAADGLICSSAPYTYVIKGAYDQTVTFPTLNNAKKFTCGTTTQYTLRQLAQQGWIVDNLHQEMISQRSGSDGTNTFVVRWTFTVRK